MKIAKFFLVSILALMVFSGCAQMQQGAGKTSASPVLDRIQQRGELIVGTMGNMPPLNMTSKDGEIFGLEPDLARMLADAMDVKVKFVTKPFNELLPALQTGEVDMVLSGMTITPERNRKVAFIGPYFISGKAFLTNILEQGGSREPLELFVAFRGREPKIDALLRHSGIAA
jgi:polar amino acid transport system substrate-binding protein